MKIHLFLQIGQIILSILITVLVLLQNKDGGISSNIGSIAGQYSSRRGLEKFIFFATILCGLLLVVTSVLLVLSL
ncbi:MAG: preprotein translocase subunit SecG [Patescibacteria group bacterium]|uniref:Protein-export membrane protein SecG n=1 Tax=candidate division WWE3 bacterium TaxID=2053526 RepID=A0A955ECQ7_UNCKA|nr:preprotein translocase subunit SecG [candidate division WWE3 bacterium]